MTTPTALHGAETVSISLPVGVTTRVIEIPERAPAPDPIAAVAAALDRPRGLPPLTELAAAAKRAVIVVPDPSRPAPAETCLLPVIARLARGGLTPREISIVVARGLHPASTRAEVVRLLGQRVMDALRAVQSAPDTPEMNLSIGVDEELGDVRVHRLVAEADLVVLTGAVQPHHLAGFGGGPKALVPGVAERDTILAAHRLTLRGCLGPDGSVRSVSGSYEANPFRDALLRVATAFGRCFLLNVVLTEDEQVVAAEGGEVGAAHRAIVEAWRGSEAPPVPERSDLVVVGTPAPFDRDLVQAHKALIAAAAWAKPGAPIVWLAKAATGVGHPSLLPWFEIRRPEQHLAALHKEFHPYGLTAWSIRRIAAEHPVHVVSDLSPDLLKPLKLLPFPTIERAVAHALANYDVKTATILPRPW